MLSLFITPIVLVSNVIQYLRSLMLASPAADAEALVFTDRETAPLEPVREHLVNALEAGTEPALIARETAAMAGVTPGQAYHFLCVVNQEAQRPKAGVA